MGRRGSYFHRAQRDSALVEQTFSPGMVPTIFT